MCLKTFYGFTCGHTSPCYLVKCPLTLQNEVFPPCSIPGIHQVFANQYCHGCMRCVWNKEVIIEEEAHKGRHERGECGCEIIFDREERERRERERELKEREGSTGASGRDGAGRARQRGRGKGRGVAGNAGDKDGEEGKQMEEGGGDYGMIRGFNRGFMMSAAPSGHFSPRPNDPASLHPDFEYANNKYMPAGQTDDSPGHVNNPTMNRITGVIPGMPILSPPPVTSTSEWHKDMMVIPRADRMDLFGAYPTAHPTHSDQNPFQMPPLPPLPPAGPSAWQNASMAPSTSTNIYQGNHYTWSFNLEPVVPSMHHHGAPNQPRLQHPMQTGVTDQFSYQNPQQIDHDTPRDAYNYVGYYMAQRNTNGSPPGGPQAAVSTAHPQARSSFMLAPMIPALPSSAAGQGMIVRFPDTSLPPLPRAIPRFNAAAPTAPRHDTDAAVVSRRDERNAQPDVTQGLRIGQSVGPMNVQIPNTTMQAPTAVTTTGTTSMDFHTTQATNQGQATMCYDATGQATTQGQSPIESEDTSETISVSNIHTPRVISIIARPKSTI